MIFSTNFSSKAVVSLVTVLICLSGWAAANESVVSVADDSSVVEKKLSIAVWPVSNLSGTPAPLKDIRQLLINSFKKEGLNILDEEVLEKFILKHRLRYVGGIDRTTARDLRYETGADAVLITSVELYSEVSPPKIALTSRLVATGNNPEILWMDGMGLAGDDSIGILELSLIEDPQKLLSKAVRHLSTSVAKYLAGEKYWTGSQRKIIKFWPKAFYSSPIIEPGMRYTVAVAPFFNLSERRFAGEIMNNHFVRQLRRLENFAVIEPGIVRHALLKYRVIMHDGISLDGADILFSRLGVDLVLGGKVFDYQDYQGAAGKPKVGFSALMIERKSREVVWASQSHNEGDDGVFFFDWGKVNTAHAMASDMVLLTVGTIFE